jgi:cell division protein FtsN
MDMKLTHLKNNIRGGTMLGIIIGVLVGLGAALAVAIYVAKVPVPFVNKSQPKAADQDAAEAKKNKDWDPNAPLYGKNQGKNPAAVAAGAVGNAPSVITAPAPGKVPAVAPVAASPAAPAAPVAATPKPVPAPAIKPGSADPLGDLAKAKTAAAGSTAAGADPFTYSVQAGAYRTPEDAETQRAKLGMLGFDAKISEREQSGHTVYRVRVGPFDKKDEAEKAKEKLDGNGVDTALVRVQR